MSGYCLRPIAVVLSVLSLAAKADELPDIQTVPTDLSVPALSEGEPGPGKRVALTAPAYQGTEVHHVLYLPTDWQAGKKYPVIVEYAGNGPFSNKNGDVSTGRVSDSRLGYGISGGKGVIWLCLPYISPDHKSNQLQWWGDVEATVAYCRAVVPEVCTTWGGDPGNVFLAGFSRGAIACNFIGLHDDDIARLWRGFICHSHYDGVRQWNYAGSDAESAGVRLARLGNRPQFISQENGVMATQVYLKKACPQGNFTFQPLGFRNHTDAWGLRDIPERRAVRQWLAAQLHNPPE